MIFFTNLKISLTINIMSNLEENEDIIFNCPNCEEIINFKKYNLFNNMMYRHGILKSNGKWINPYMSNILCERYLYNKKINGCGKHFKIIFDNELNKYIADKYNINN